VSGSLDAVRRVVTGDAGRSVVWRVAGGGRPLVLLHGGYGSWTHWLRNIVPLSAVATVLAPDMPGFGESDDPADLDSVSAIADPLIAGLNDLIGADVPFDLAAFSFGASIAGEIAFRCNGRVGRLILVGAGGLALTRPDSAELASWRALTDPAAIERAHRHNLENFMFHRPETVDEETIALQAENSGRARVRSRIISRRGLLRDRLGSFGASLHGIWGAEDVTARGFMEERAALLRRFDPASSMTIIPAAGHWVQYEAHEAVNGCIQRLLSEADGRVVRT
jgi:pimeloyl-ACP methyl ester carboxylesterase